MSKYKYVFLDIETSGTDPDLHEVIEVGAVKDDPDYEELAFSLDFSLSKASPVALQVNGYGVRDFAPRLEPSDAADLLYGFLKGYVVVGQAVQFDAAFLRVFLRAHGYDTPWNFRIVELSSLVSGYLKVPPPIKSEFISEQLGISNEDKHTALADAKWNREVFRAIVPAVER